MPPSASRRIRQDSLGSPWSSRVWCSRPCNLHCISTAARGLAPGRRVRIRVVRGGQSLVFAGVVVHDTGRGDQPGPFEGVARAWVDAYVRDLAG